MNQQRVLQDQIKLIPEQSVLWVLVLDQIGFWWSLLSPSILYKTKLPFIVAMNKVSCFLVVVVTSCRPHVDL